MESGECMGDIDARQAGIVNLGLGGLNGQVTGHGHWLPTGRRCASPGL